MAAIHVFSQGRQEQRPDRHDPRLSDLLPLWLTDRRADGRRPRGVRNYEEVFRRFLVFVGDIPVSGITTQVVQMYKRHLMTHVANGTARHALTVIRMFCAWAVDQGYLAYNPALSVAHPKVFPPDPDPLPRDAIYALLRALDTPPARHRQVWQRNRRAICLMLYAGLRLAEVAGLEARDIDLDRRTVIVRREVAKGGRPRVVPICDELAVELEPIRDYQPSWAVVDQGDAPDRRGKPLQIKSLAHIFERWLPRRGIVVHAHQLRKTFATELYLRGEELVTIQRLLGHADPKTTMRYIGVSSATERAAVARLTFRADMRA
jgi:integrase